MHLLSDFYNEGRAWLKGRMRRMTGKNSNVDVSDLISRNNESIIKIFSDNIANAIQLFGEQHRINMEELMLLETRLTERLVFERGFLPLPALTPPGRPHPVVRSAPSLDACMQRLQQAAPLNFDAYVRCVNVGTASYEGLPPQSCSTEQHPQSRLFRAFARPYMAGHILDVGCGPQAVPSYLLDIPLGQISGIDPISTQDQHPFQFVSGVGEYLPFDNDSFDTIVSGTTLDHYYLLDLGLKEAFRVLRPGGHFLAWITEFAGAPAYDPYTATIEPYDSEHMFHVDRAWFIPLMKEHGFSEVETVHFKLPFNYLFMAFSKPNGP
jgi:SAM-dependent methyltransferase